MKKRFMCIIVTLILVAPLLLLGGCFENTAAGLESSPYAVSSEKELKNVIKDFSSSLSQGSKGTAGGAQNDMAAAPESAASGDSSKTNTQVAGVDEGDIVKNDGNLIYKLQGSGLNIYSVDNGALTEESKTPFSDFYPYELFIYSTQNKKLAVILGGVYSKSSRIFDSPAIEPMCCFYYYSSSTCVKIYDVTSPSSPSLCRELTLDGNYLTSRIYEGKLYFMSNYYFYYSLDDSYIPQIKDSLSGGGFKNIDFHDIYYYKSVPSFNYLIAGSINLSDTSKSSLKAYLGVSGEIYFSGNYFYAVSYDSEYKHEQAESGGTTYYEYMSKSRIIKFASSTLKQVAITRIDGNIKDRYSLDEYEGNLRVATSVYHYSYHYNTAKKGDTAANDVMQMQNDLYSNVYVLDANLKTIGKIEKIAEGERIYSVRFTKEIGSLVTFRNIDPYFKLDLSDPKNPKIAGELKEEGVSDYLHPIEGTDLMIGVGRTAITREGGFTTFAGIKVALYDISGSSPVALVTDDKSLDRTAFYVSAYTELGYNPKALLYSLPRGLFAFPVQIWTYDNYYSYSTMEQGLAVFGFSAENKTLEFRGILSDLPKPVSRAYNDYYYSYWSQIQRGIQIDGYIYTISDRFITSYDIATLSKVDSISCGESAYYSK